MLARPAGPRCRAPTSRFGLRNASVLKRFGDQNAKVTLRPGRGTRRNGRNGRNGRPHNGRRQAEPRDVGNEGSALLGPPTQAAERARRDVEGTARDHGMSQALDPRRGRIGRADNDGEPVTLEITETITKADMRWHFECPVSASWVGA